MNAKADETGTLALRTPPHNIEAEKQLLGGIMLNNRALETAGAPECTASRIEYQSR